VVFLLQESFVLPANYLEKLPSDLRVDVRLSSNISWNSLLNLFFNLI
jgi:hypothetical protein